MLMHEKKNMHDPYMLSFHSLKSLPICLILSNDCITIPIGERGGSVVECRTPEREVRGSRPTAAVLCP